MTDTTDVRTSDLALATYLRMNDQMPTRLEMLDSGPSRAEFVFDVDHVEELVHAYRQGTARVEPRKFALEFKSTRDELFDFLNASKRL